MAAPTRKVTLSDIQETRSLDILRDYRSSINYAVKWEDMLSEPLYGRVCNTLPGTPVPSKLSLRRTAFVFGPETVCSALLILKPYELLKQLGYESDYIYLKTCKQKRNFSLLLFRQKKAIKSKMPIEPATWSGVTETVRRCYPLAIEAVLNNLEEMKQNSCEYFENKAELKFSEALKDTSGPLFMTYKKFIALDKPQTAWQTRFFLYCELRLLEVYSGDGYTKTEDGNLGLKEYICPNIDIEELGSKNYILLPLGDVQIPHEVAEKFSQ